MQEIFAYQQLPSVQEEKTPYEERRALRLSIPESWGLVHGTAFGPYTSQLETWCHEPVTISLKM
jgi:hypothetical protein